MMDDSQPNEINDVAPTSLAHVIGQRGVAAQVAVALDAAQMDNRKFDHALLVGSPGLGKSALARVIAAEMASDLHEVLGQSIAGPADLNALLLGPGTRTSSTSTSATSCRRPSRRPSTWRWTGGEFC